MTLESRYERYSLPVRRWDSAESFQSGSDLLAGIDVVELSGGARVELLTTRDVTAPRASALPVFFNGAITNRAATAPPYFGGIDLGQELDGPIVSISDPLFSVDPEINLGWYTGAGQANVQHAISDILKTFREKCTSLILIGGGGGSFAALYYANRISGATRALAWNLETDLLHYNPAFVRKYLATSLQDDTWLLEENYDENSARAALTAAGIHSRIASFENTEMTFILQSQDNWRVGVHALPLLKKSGWTHYVEGLYVSANGRCGLAFTGDDMENGIPQTRTLTHAVRAMSKSTTPVATYGALVAAGAVENTDPLGATDHALKAEPNKDGKVSIAPLNFLGKKMVLAGFVGDYIFEGVRSSGQPYERVFLEALVEQIDPGDLVVDVGANIGNHTIALAVGAGAHVVAFEPHDPVAQILAMNASLNGLDGSIVVERAAVGSEPGHARPATVDWSNVGSTRFEMSDTGARVIRLDDYAFENPVRLIKIDAEGMDIDVLRGARATIDRDRPVLSCEVSDPQDLDLLDEFVADIGYTYLSKFNATPTYVLVPARSAIERVRVDRLRAVQATQTHLAARDLQWQANMLRVRTEQLEIQTGSGH